VTTIHGHVDEGFGAVADVFASNFETGGEVGAECCIYVDGTKRVDLWAGVADTSTGRPWDETTLALVFSTTKGITATAIAMLVQSGAISYDDRVADHWPEFAAAGKGDITIGELMSHQAGLITIEPSLDLDEILAATPAIESLQVQSPMWRRGDGHGYHAITYGWLAGEVLTRVTGTRIGRFVHDEIAEPLGIDMWIGLPEHEEHRVAVLENPPPTTDPEMSAFYAQLYERGANGYRALTLDGRMRTMPENLYNTRAVHAAEMPAVNAITSARALARMYAATIGEVDGVRLVGHDTMQAARTERASGTDRTLLVDTRFGAGFWLHGDSQPMMQDGSFGHPGAGGSLAFANPELGVGFAYVMNQMGHGVSGDPRNVALGDALLRCIAA
jgi:CubicO group peptidase (beta-lactamase class C family)